MDLSLKGKEIMILLQITCSIQSPLIQSTQPMATSMSELHCNNTRNICMQLVIQVLFKSGFVVCKDAPFLGASPDGKVIDAGCSEPYGLVEVKCPETKYSVTPLDACSDPKFCSHEVAGIPQLKHDHDYYAQIQGQLGVTQAK